MVVTIDDRLVRQLVSSQFPQWADLPLSPVAVGGWDNRCFRLGDKMVVRLPSSAAYASQVEKEQRWLPKLAPLLPLPIPMPLALGEPAKGYPWRWSIYGWLEGEMAAPERIRDPLEFGFDVAHFLAALRRIDASEGPAPGPHNFQRGGAIATYDAETRGAIESLRGRIDEEAAICVWEAALGTAWQGSPVWVHGDVSAGNLLIQEGRLSAVIDFGMLAIGDPACDLSIAWTLLESESRSVFRTTLGVDPAGARGLYGRP